MLLLVGTSVTRDTFALMARKTIPTTVTLQVLTEAGYRCAVPTCRNILAIDLHHMVEVSEKGGDTLGNLLALCPTCHALFHRGTISRDSIYAWKLMVVSLSHAFDTNTIDDLLFLKRTQESDLLVTGDGVLKFSRLIGGGQATFRLAMQNGPMILYKVGLTDKGNQLVDAWVSGNREAVALAMGKVEESVSS
jgi:HNH endonuclease